MSIWAHFKVGSAPSLGSIPSAKGFKKRAAVQLPAPCPPVYNDVHVNSLVHQRPKKKRYYWRFGDLRLKNESEDHTLRQEAYARNDHVQRLLLHQDHSRACPKSTPVRYQNDIERVGDRTRTYGENARVDFSHSNHDSTRIEVNVCHA